MKKRGFIYLAFLSLILSFSFLNNMEIQADYTQLTLKNNTEIIKSYATQSGLIKVALWKNLFPRANWANGTLYHLKMVKKFIPISIDVVETLPDLGSYQVLFVNRLNISDVDIQNITSWVSYGGYLVWIGQSGRYYENGSKRTLHPMASVLGIKLNSWERTIGTTVSRVTLTSSWLWWTKGDYHTFSPSSTSNVLRENTIDASLNGAVSLMAITDTNDKYPTQGLTRNSFGMGKAYFVAADFFYEIEWHSLVYKWACAKMDEDTRIYQIFSSGLPVLWQMIYGIFLDLFPKITILTSMPYGLYTAIGYTLHTETARDGRSGKDTMDDWTYSNLTKWQAPYLYDKFPTLQGWFWAFILRTNLIDNTSNATNLVNFMKEYGRIGTHSHTHQSQKGDYQESLDFLNSLDLGYKFPTAYPGFYDLPARDFYDLLESNLSLLDWGAPPSYEQTYEKISLIPFVVFNATHPQIIKQFKGASAEPAKWNNTINSQKLFAKDYGIGGISCVYYHADESAMKKVKDILDDKLKDNTVWKTNPWIFEDWWLDRWQVDIIGYSETSSQISIELQTPDIYGLTLLIRGTNDNIQNAKIDGKYLGYYPETKILIIPHLTSGFHSIVINLVSGASPNVPYLQSGYEQGHVRSVKNLTKSEYDPQAKKLTLLASQSGIRTWSVNATNQGKPSSVKVDGTPILFTYFDINKTVQFNILFSITPKEVVVEWPSFGKPTDLVATTIDWSTIELTWTDNSADEDDFHIERSMVGGGSGFSEIGVAPANATYYRDETCSENTEYYYRVRAHRHADDLYSSYSNEHGAVTKIRRPTGLVAVSKNYSSIQINWADNSEVETGYSIERSSGGDNIFSEIATVGADIETYTDTGCEADTKYYYRVRAFVGGTYSDHSNEADATTPPLPNVFVKVLDSEGKPVANCLVRIQNSTWYGEKLTDEEGWANFTVTSNGAYAAKVDISEKSIDFIYKGGDVYVLFDPAGSNSAFIVVTIVLNLIFTVMAILISARVTKGRKGFNSMSNSNW